MRRSNKDLNLLSFKVKPVRQSRKATSDGFNGYGKTRSNHNVSYGTYSAYVKRSGIYWIKNNITDRFYIGSSKDIGSRLIKHFSQLRVGNHPNNLLLADFNKYGQKAFEFGVYEFTEVALFEKERDYQLQYPLDELYNLQIKDSHRSDAQRLSAKTSSKTTHKTAAYRDKMRTIKQNKIGKFDRFTGEFLEVFSNSDEIYTKYGIAKSTLLGCCNGSKKTAYGFVWHYLNENNDIILQGKGRTRTVITNEDIV